MKAQNGGADYDVLVIGAGLSGLAAGALLAKRGLHVGVIDRAARPGGSCGVFKRDGATFDQGAAMLYGFGERGFNAHRFVFNCLEEPIDVLRHELLYRVRFRGRFIPFPADIGAFVRELSAAFPAEEKNIRRFYGDMYELYRKVLAETPSYTTPDETAPLDGLRSLLRHPAAEARFLSLLERSAASLLGEYFRDPEIFKFFDKLTSTYCYATVREAPAVLAAVMFVDNHVGGSYYPAGSTLFLPGKLEKAIEENGGDMLLGREAREILFENGRPAGVRLENGQTLRAGEIIYSGTVWNLYGKLLSAAQTRERCRMWAAKQVPTYPSVVLYAVVDRAVIPDGTAPIEMLVGNPDRVDESEVTVYIQSIDDRTLCAPDEHTVVAIGPSFAAWDEGDEDAYRRRKAEELERLAGVLEERFPGFLLGLRHAELSTPRTIERYTMKNGGAVAGPKQMLGQQMLHRQHTRTAWDNLFCCGESTVMGTGTPAVTVSGIAAANAVLRRRGLAPWVYEKRRPDYVRVLQPPYLPAQLFADCGADEREARLAALRCQLCERPSCAPREMFDVQGLLRRVAVGNFAGAERCLPKDAGAPLFARCEQRCILAQSPQGPVRIGKVAAFVRGRTVGDGLPKV